MPSVRWNRFAKSIAALCAVGLAACSKQPAVQPAPPVPVTVAPVVHGSAPNVVTASGTVEPMQTASVGAQVSGLVTSVAFREGDMVRRGQVLFRVDPRPYAATFAQAQAARARDQAQAASAHRDADRYAALVKNDYVTKSQADGQSATAAALAATVNADRAAIQKARLDLDNTVIRAPISGRTGRLLVHEGNLVQGSPAQPLVVINQLDPILVRFDLPAAEFPDVQRYSRAGALTVRVVPVEAGVDTVRGRLTFIDNAIDTTTGTLELKGQFANASGQLWAGQFVQVSLQLDVQPEALLIPATAVQTGQHGPYVFVVGANGRAAMRNIATGQTIGSAIVVTKGLTAGERVVTDGQSRLGPGTQVRIAGEANPQRIAAETTP